MKLQNRIATVLATLSLCFTVPGAFAQPPSDAPPGSQAMVWEDGVWKNGTNVVFGGQGGFAA